MDRHPRSPPGLARVVHVPAAVPVRPGAHDRAIDRQRRVPRRGGCGGACSAAWCVVERAGWSLIDESFAGHRVGGPFGQPAYVGAAAVLLLPLAAGRRVRREGRAACWRMVGALGALSAGAALLLSQTRGAWLGVAVASAAWRRGTAAVVRRRWREIAVAAFGGRRAVRGDTARRPASPTTFDLGHGTHARPVRRLGRRCAGRSNIIRCSASVPRATGSCSPRSFPPGTSNGTAASVIPDRAHNAVLDVGASGGVIAALLYAALLAGWSRSRGVRCAGEIR